MQLSTKTLVFVAATQASGVSATFFNLGSWGCSISWLWGQSCSTGVTVWQWPPAAPAKCPTGYPWAQVPWTYTTWKYPGKCPSHPYQSGPVYPSGCNSNPTKPSTPKTTTTVVTTTTKSVTKTATVTVTSTPTAPVWQNFTLACPSAPAGQIFDGQIQCNSPYPAQEVAAGRVSWVKSTFYIQNGGLYDEMGRGCEISSGNQLQCNVLVNGATAETGFAIDSSSNLIWQGENTWYGCNIGTDSSYGQILFTGTHLDFSGVQKATENANCAAYRLGVTFV